MFGSLLVANRGEIARRIFRTARRMGVRPLAVYSAADAAAPHVREADAAALIGPAPAADSYLRIDAVLAAARDLGADAIHPGYGFLSENADFAEAVVAAGIAWVGPPPAAIRAMGLKDAAKTRMAAAGVPVTPGYQGADQAEARLAAEAEAIGWPVLIKAVAGGGGKGMRKVERAEDFADALAGARREAAGAFGDDRVLLEKYIARARHIEVQVFADRHGNAVHLFERDCSLQRRHQKVIEEAPAPGMDGATRDAVCAAAVRAALAVGYEGAGTVEFIADASGPLSAERIWFMEMNTRLQVEHPVTELITGLDLVEWQLRVAAGEPLPLAQDQIRLDGHAIEARLYAEDPANGFLPSVGPLEVFALDDETARVDAGVEEGGEVSPYYDPMLAKVIVHAGSRESAAAALAGNLKGAMIWPVRTNAGFLVRCLEDPAFRAGDVSTALIEARQEGLTPKPLPSEPLMDAPDPTRVDAAGPWLARRMDGFRMNAPPVETAIAFLDGEPIEVSVTQAIRLAAEPGGEFVRFLDGEAYAYSIHPPLTGAGAADAVDGALRSPMPGRIASVAANAGERVARGQTVLVLEAMKMEHALVAPFEAVVSELSVEVGQQVREGVVLARLEPSA